jgi:hypothetical protein
MILKRKERRTRWRKGDENMRENSNETEDGRYRDKRYKRDKEDIKTM